MTLFQSTHPHGVRPMRVRDIDFVISVSIHAPTRGATAENMRKQNTWFVSIHAPTRGATFALSNIKIYIYVSIHAPTRGATAKYLHNNFIQSMFQSTHPHGVRQFTMTFTALVSGFQSTHPHGVRHRNHFKSVVQRGFNPRTHTGCDTLLDFFVFSEVEFQSTHPHGVRHAGFRIY